VATKIYQITILSFLHNFLLFVIFLLFEPINLYRDICSLVPRCRLDTYAYDRLVYLIAGPTVWNSLPDELTDPTNV